MVVHNSGVVPKRSHKWISSDLLAQALLMRFLLVDLLSCDDTSGFVDRSLASQQQQQRSLYILAASYRTARDSG